jgi:hypothetical protein
MKRLFSKNFHITTLILFLAFSVSVLVRLDNIKAPMGRHHEYITAHVLCTNYRFHSEGASKFYFAPVMNFNVDPEHRVAKYHSIIDKENNFYYYSYPPFTFILPHLVFTTFNIEPSVIGIRILGLLIHFISAFLIYLIVLKLFNRTTTDPFYFPSFVGFLLYTFSTGNLWYHCNLFFADILIQPIILTLILLFLKYFSNSINNKKIFYVLLFVFSFIAIYTEYFAFFFLFFIGLILLIAVFSQRSTKPLVALSIIFTASLASISLTIFQFSSISSIKILTEALRMKYSIRSGHSSDITQSSTSIKNSMSFDQLFDHYEQNYSALLDYSWLGLLVIVGFLIFNRTLILQYCTKGKLLVFIAVLFSFVVHILALFNFNVVHDFGTIKSTLFTIPISAFAIGLIFESVKDKLRVKKLMLLLISIYTAYFIHVSLTNYYLVNDSSTSAKFVTVLPKLADKYGDENQMLAANVYFTYETAFYSKRRIEDVINIFEFKRILKFCDIKTGVFFERTPDCYNVIKINQNGDTLLFNKEPLLEN